jgi:hypothetical protein
VVRVSAREPYRQPVRGQTRAEAAAEHRRRHYLTVGPHLRRGESWRDPNRGPAATRAAGGALRAETACGRIMPAALSTDQRRKVKCPACKEAPEPSAAPPPADRPVQLALFDVLAS